MNLLKEKWQKLGELREGKIIVGVTCMGQWHYNLIKKEEIEINIEELKNYKSRIGEELKNGDYIIGEALEGGLSYIIGIKEHFDSSVLNNPFMTAYIKTYSAEMIEEINKN